MPTRDPALDASADESIRARIAEWRSAESEFFRSVMADPDLYMAAILFVRAAADGLSDAEDLGRLVRDFERGAASDLGPIAESLNVPKLVLLDYSLARKAAFYLRSRRLQADASAADAARRLAEARQRREEWVLLWNHERTQNGHLFFDRLEVRLADGAALHLTHGIDLEAGWIYSLEPLRVDLESGRVITEGASRPARLDFATLDELEAEVARHKAELDGSDAAPGGEA